MAIEFSDTFNRADGAIGTSSSGGIWSEWNNALTVVSNRAQQENANACGIFTPELSSSDQFAEATVVSFTAGISSFAGPVVRAPATIGTTSANTEALYLITVSNTTMDFFTIRRKESLSATVTVLASATQAIAPGDVLRLEAQGDALRAYRNGALVVSASGAVLTAQRRAGIFNDAGAGATLVWDDFSAGALSTPSLLIPRRPDRGLILR
jgi:hypothetical protein